MEDYESDYDHLFLLTNKTTLDVRKLRFLAIEIFKTITNLNPSFMKEIFILNTRRDDQTKKLLVQNQTDKSQKDTQTQSFLDENNIIYDFQSGFRKNHSTDSCLGFLNDN